MPQVLADITTSLLSLSTEDEDNSTVDYEDITDSVFENDAY